MEGYSLDKYRKAPEALPKEKEERLKAIEASQAEVGKYLDELEQKYAQGDIGGARFLACQVLEAFKPSNLKYLQGGGFQEYRKLLKEFDNTKEGQLDLAHGEAAWMNKRYDALVKNVADKAREYEGAVTELSDFVEKLNSSKAS